MEDAYEHHRRRGLAEDAAARAAASRFDLSDDALAELEALGDGQEFHFRAGFAGRWGDLELVSVTPGLGEYFGVDAGLLVVRSPQDEALGLKDVDVILAIDGREPTSPWHAMRILRSYEPGETISFAIIRSREKRTVKV